MENKQNKYLFWTPRILSIVFILFLAVFSLDVFEKPSGLWDTVLGLLLHNIPSIILLIVLLISWKREIIGGVVYILAGVLYMVWAPQRFQGYQLLMCLLTIAGPAFLVGILFLIGWIKKRKV